MSSMAVRTKRRSRGADTLLEAANRILRILGVNTSKQAKPAHHKSKINGRPQSPRPPAPSPPAGAMPPPAPSPAPPAAAPAAAPAPSPAPAPALDHTAKRTPKDFIFGKVIGEGCFSTVYLAKYIQSGKEYAIKVCDKKHILREKKAEYISREKAILNMLFNCSHGFVRLFCTFQDNDRLYFVLSYAKNGELLPHINKVGSFDIECTRFYAAELLMALEQMHSRGIIHRDLKPENILLDEDMHVLITDFGSAKILETTEPETKTPGNSGTDENRPEERQRRRMSFVGTAQYVSPELLTDKCVSRASDLWALGCIIYQMVSGLPPFRAGSEYLIFQKIMNLDYKFPEGFAPEAKDLVEKLLVLDPTKRLGALDEGNIYESIRSHQLFKGVEWDRLRERRPPAIYPYLPGRGSSDALRSQYCVPDHLEPGLDDLQLTRLLGLDLADPVPLPLPQPVGDIPSEEFRRRLEKQRETNKWHRFVEGNLIIKQGLVDKRKGLFARRRMLLLTTGPRLFYVDPANMVVKGEIPWSEQLRVEPKNFRIFFVHTPNRTYYLEDPESFALEWCKAIEGVRLSTYPQAT